MPWTRATAWLLALIMAVAGVIVWLHFLYNRGSATLSVLNSSAHAIDASELDQGDRRTRVGPVQPGELRVEELEPDPEADLHYRARLDDGTILEWSGRPLQRLGEHLRLELRSDGQIHARRDVY